MLFVTSQSQSQCLPLHPLLLTKLTETSKSQKIDSKVSTKTKTKTFQNFNMPPPLNIQKHFYKTNSRPPITTVLYQAKARQRDTAGGALLFQAAMAWAIQGYLNCHTICQLDRELLGSSLLPEGFKLLHSIQGGVLQPIVSAFLGNPNVNCHKRTLISFGLLKLESVDYTLKRTKIQYCLHFKLNSQSQVRNILSILSDQ